MPHDNVVHLAEKSKAKIIALEHRFYGHSQPARNWTTDSLRTLNIEQVLRDLVSFASEKGR
jgi:hypothetical protein